MHPVQHRDEVVGPALRRRLNQVGIRRHLRALEQERARLGILADNLLRLAEQLLLDLRVVELAHKDHLVVDFAQKLELHREIVRSSVHHVAGQRGEPDFLVAEHADRAARHHLAAFLADDCVIRAGIQVSKLSVLFHNHSLRPFRILSCVLFNFFKLGSQFIKQNTFQHLSSTNREVSQSLLLFPRFLRYCLCRINEFFQEEPPMYRPLPPQL